MKYTGLWLSITGMVVLTVLYLNINGSIDSKMLDISTWNENNVNELGSIILSIRELEKWPKYSKVMLNKENSNRNNRRRLSEDKWAQEEREMQNEITTFYKANKSSSGGQNSPKGITNVRISDKKRKIEENGLPPISSNCTDPTASLACPPENLPQVCDKYNNGNLEDCFQLCKPSLCCTYASQSTSSQSCDVTEPNCRNYIPCYIVWWKLSDTVGPATFLRLPNSKNHLDFFNFDTDFVFSEINVLENAPFYNEFFSRFTADDSVLDDQDFLLPSNWDQVFNNLPIEKQ